MTSRVSAWLVAGTVGVGGAACASHQPVVARPAPFPSIASRTESPAGPSSPSAAISAIIQTALDLRGTPYRTGGAQPGGGFDCSGLVRYVFLEHRIDLPRTVAEQARAGTRIDFDKVRPGDLLFFALDGREPTHVGLVIDPDEFIHAPGTGRVVRVEHFTSPYWASHFVDARRIDAARDASN
jgi:murein DD-endopeptidase